MVDSSSLSWLRSELFVFVLAAVGGIVVLIGLWWEYKSTDESRYEKADINVFRSLKLLEKRGEKWVIVGIIIEVVVAVIFVGRDDWQLRKTDPKNQNITSILGMASVEIKGEGIFFAFQFRRIIHMGSP